MSLTDKQRADINSFKERMTYAFYNAWDKMGLHFYMTYRCNLACPLCYMQASPKRPIDHIPAADAVHFINYFNNVPGYAKVICCSGGEPLMMPLNELEVVLRTGIENGLFVALKTNGFWAKSNFKSEQVYNMLSSVLRDADGRKNPSGDRPLQIDISVDDVIHPKESVDCFNEIATRISNDKKLANNIHLYLMSFAQSTNLVCDKIIFNKKIGASNPRHAGGITKFEVGDLAVSADLRGGSVYQIGPIKSSRELETVFEDKFLWLIVHPNGMIGLEADQGKNCAMVPYKIGEQYKDWATLRTDMLNQLVAEYTELVRQGR